MEALKEAIKKGDKLTIFTISAFASTMCNQIVVREITSEGIIFSEPRKRKRFILKFPLKNDVMIFKGHDLPIMNDHDFYGNRFTGNACFNLGSKVYSKEQMKLYINNHQLNKNFDQHDHILYMTDDIDEPELVYPELESNSSLINRLKTEQGYGIASNE